MSLPLRSCLGPLLYILNGQDIDNNLEELCTLRQLVDDAVVSVNISLKSLKHFCKVQNWENRFIIYISMGQVARQIMEYDWTAWLNRFRSFLCSDWFSFDVVLIKPCVGGGIYILHPSGCKIMYAIKHPTSLSFLNSEYVFMSIFKQSHAWINPN